MISYIFLDNFPSFFNSHLVQRSDYEIDLFAGNFIRILFFNSSIDII